LGGKWCLRETRLLLALIKAKLPVPLSATGNTARDKLLKIKLRVKLKTVKKGVGDHCTDCYAFRELVSVVITTCLQQCERYSLGHQICTFVDTSKKKMGYIKPNTMITKAGHK